MKLSIIIPTLGRTCLTDVLRRLQSCEGYKTLSPEVLVVFDGQAVPNALRKTFPEVSFFSTEHQQGAGIARNIAIDKAMGDVLVFISDDTIPVSSWLEKVHDFHQQHPEPEAGLLGKVSWTKELAEDPFHQWLETHAQFQFQKLQTGLIPRESWPYFYTSNVSVKTDFLALERFSNQFKGWGFEDIELGYRLHEKGLQLHYDPAVEVLHDHPQTFEGMIEMTRSARSNGEVFEKIHPEIEILPSGMKQRLLSFLLFFLKLAVPFHQKLRWWFWWKKTWLGQ